MSQYVYGFAASSIEEVKQELESLLRITFEPRHSHDRCGDYYVFRDRANDVEIFLQENCEEDPGYWAEDEHRDMITLLYYSADQEGAEATNALLVNRLKGIKSLRHSTL